MYIAFVQRINMYFAQQKNKNLYIYVSLLRRLAEGKDTTSLEEMKEVILSAKHISEGDQDIYTARNDYFELISYLLSNSTKLLDPIVNNKITKITFENIANKLNDDLYVV